jgi:hypothetical protein
MKEICDATAKKKVWKEETRSRGKKDSWEPKGTNEVNASL